LGHVAGPQQDKGRGQDGGAGQEGRQGRNGMEAGQGADKAGQGSGHGQPDGKQSGHADLLGVKRGRDSPLARAGMPKVSPIGSEGPTTGPGGGWAAGLLTLSGTATPLWVDTR